MEYLVYNFQVFFLIMMRMHSMMMTAPFFSSSVIPFRYKALFSYFITALIFPLVVRHGYTVSGNAGEYAMMVLREVTIGIYIGFLASVIFSAFQLAGQYFAVQIGFGMSEVVDPLAQVSVPIVGQLKNLIGLLVFFYINGHHFMISAVYRSYELAPLFSLQPKSIDIFMKHLVHSFSGMFVVALKIALPVLITVFLVSVSMGILAKAAPQMNVMMLGFPFKIMVSFVLLALTAPLVVRIMQVSLERTFKFIYQMLVMWPARGS